MFIVKKGKYDVSNKIKLKMCKKISFLQFTFEVAASINGSKFLDMMVLFVSCFDTIEMW